MVLNNAVCTFIWNGFLSVHGRSSRRKRSVFRILSIIRNSSNIILPSSGCTEQKVSLFRPQTLDLLVLRPAMGLFWRIGGDVKKNIKLSFHFLSRALELWTQWKKNYKESHTQFSLNFCTIIVWTDISRTP